MASKATARNSIRTRFYGPTNSKGSRIIATSDFGRVTVSYDYELDTADNHAAAAAECLAKHWIFEATLQTDAGLCFDGDYYWTWEVKGPRKTN